MNLIEDKIEKLRSLVAQDSEMVDELINSKLSSEVPFINQLGQYIITGGGKRIRPLITLLSAKACGYQGAQHIDIAVILELVHTATLLHDDVVDDSKLRRGRETANTLWGSAASVLVGDFLYSKAFQLMVTLENNLVLKVLADTTNVIAEGEVMQLLSCHDPETTEKQYLNTIQHKTAKLFEAAAGLGAIISKNSQEKIAQMNTYGRHIGTAFQLIDDALDYESSSETLGKNIGDDLAEGKPTLPLLYAMWNGTAEQSSIIRETIISGGLQHLPEIKKAIKSTGSIQYTLNLAQTEASHALIALESIPNNEFKSALEDLVHFAIDRQS